MSTRELVIAVLVTLVCLRYAGAQPTTSASAEADTLFDQGRSLMDAGKLSEACAAFEASQKLSPATSTLLNLAHCREQNHELATAYGLYRDAERQTRAPLDDNTQALNRSASDHAKTLAPRLSKLTINVPAASRIEGLVVSRGSTALDPGAWNRDLPVDGGSFVITARAPGYLDWSTTIEIAGEHDAKAIEIPALVRAPVARVQRARSKLVPIAMASGAVVLLACAVVLDANARSEYGDALVEADDAKQASLWHGAKTKRYIAEGMAVGALATAGAAVWLYLRRNRQTDEPRIGRLDVQPVFTSNGGGLAVGGSF
jgi:hypothetical protein